jgi:hypothetical protein
LSLPQDSTEKFQIEGLEDFQPLDGVLRISLHHFNVVTRLADFPVFGAI